MDSPAPVAPPVAPAQPAADTTTTVSARDAAIASGDTGAYRQARRAERVGKPLAPVPASDAIAALAADDGEATEEAIAPAAPAQPLEQKPVSKRQQQINDYERRIAESNQRIERLEQQLQRPSTPAGDTPARPQEKPPAAWKRIATMPDAPKLSDVDADGNAVYSSLEEHAAAMALFVHDTLANEQQVKSVGEQLEADAARVIESFDQRVADAEKTNPAIRAKIAPLAHALGAQGGPFGVVARIAAISENGPQILEHFVDHQDALRALVTLPERLRGLPLQVQIEQHKEHIAGEIVKLEAKFDTPNTPARPRPQPKTLTDAPDIETLGNRPAEAVDAKSDAMRRGDTRAYREIRRQERAAGRR